VIMNGVFIARKTANTSMNKYSNFTINNVDNNNGIIMLIIFIQVALASV
jgi:hypothetical protein